MSYDALNADQRGGTSLNGKPSLTIDQAAVQLTREGLSWSSRLGTPATVTYAYRASAPTTMPADTSGFSQFTYSQITATESALRLWSSIANVTFVRVGSGNSGSAAYSDNATILFGDYSFGEAGAAAFAFSPGRTSASSQSGDVWVNTSVASNYSSQLGTFSYGFATLVHEIGHAIGLSHPSDYDASADVTLTYGQNASYAEDSREYSIMSYFSPYETGGTVPSNLSAPGGPLIDDIAAVQRLYGANMQKNPGNTVYGFSFAVPPGGELPSDTYLQSTYNGGAYWGTIWDSGGNDTLDFSRSTFANYITVAQKLDLRAGSFSDVLGYVGNLSIAQGVIIENAIGGDGDDIIIGNDVANVLTGNGGNDRITGGLGDDTINGGAGIDTAIYLQHVRQYAVTSFSGVTQVTGVEGHDSLTSIEYITFKDGSITYDVDSNAARVMRLYHSALNREPDGPGLDLWLHQIENGTPLQSVAASFLASPEFSAATGPLTNANYVEYLYAHALGRVSDTGGKAYWVGSLDSGAQTRAQVLVGFAESAEDRSLTAGTLAKGLCETDATYQQVAALYDAALGRLPDAGGLDHWSQTIKDGSLTLQAVAQAFVTAPEFALKAGDSTSSQQIVSYMYQSALHRAPDPGGLAYWSDAVDHGLSRSDLVLDFAESAEHLQLISSHITNGIDLFT